LRTVVLVVELGLSDVEDLAAVDVVDPDAAEWWRPLRVTTPPTTAATRHAARTMAARRRGRRARALGLRGDSEGGGR